VSEPRKLPIWWSCTFWVTGLLLLVVLILKRAAVYDVVSRSLDQLEARTRG